MSAAIQRNHCYSADVQMHLTVNGHIFSIGQLGPDFLLLDEPADHPSATAEITLSIDGRAQSWPVQLPDGIAAAQRRTRITPCQQVNGPTAG